MKKSRNVCQAMGRLLGLAALFAALPLRAQGTCAQWDVGSSLTVVQSNDTAVQLYLKQGPNGFSGTASFGRMVEDDFWMCSIAACGDSYESFSGPVVGTVKGNVFEATVYWSDHRIGVYTGEVGPQGLLVGTAFDKTDPSNTARWHSDRILQCASAVSAPPPVRTGVLLGRVQTPVGTPPAKPRTLCEAAASARARNSPAAPGLEKQCRAQGGVPALAAPAPTDTVSDRGGVAALAPKALGRVTPSTVPGSKGIGTTAPDLVSAREPAPMAMPAAAPAAAPAPFAPSAPVRAPHDLVVGRISYTQEGRRVTQPMAGKAVEISCSYFVNKVEGAFNFGLLPWQGLILIGGQAGQTLNFRGAPAGGQHAARVAWMPTAAERTPISCVLNPQFDAAELNAGNNRWNETVDVIASDDPDPVQDQEAPAADDQGGEAPAQE